MNTFVIGPLDAKHEVEIHVFTDGMTTGEHNIITSVTPGRPSDMSWLASFGPGAPKCASFA